MAPIDEIGVETLKEIASDFPVAEVNFDAYGDMTIVPIYVWNLMEACLNEALTNVARHADAKQVQVNLDVTCNLVRLLIENDGAKSKVKGDGIGLRNLRKRAAAVGGNISIEAGKTFRVICVVPINKSSL
jgi:signal transduction histidine kinase